jgi:hypothetical protein
LEGGGWNFEVGEWRHEFLGWKLFAQYSKGLIERGVLDRNIK